MPIQGIGHLMPIQAYEYWLHETNKYLVEAWKFEDFWFEAVKMLDECNNFDFMEF